MKPQSIAEMATSQGVVVYIDGIRQYVHHMIENRYQFYIHTSASLQNPTHLY